MAKNKKDFPNPSKAENPFRWTPTSKYPELIRNACDNYGFEFSDNEMLKLEQELSKFPKQMDNLCPVSLAVWPSKDAMSGLSAWLIDQAKKEDVNVGLCIFGNQLTLTRKSYRFHCGRSVLKPVIIDIKRSKAIYLDDDGGWQEMPLGIEIVSFLALNPHVIKLLDYKTLPNIRMTGIRMCENLEPVIGYQDGFFIKFEAV